VKYPDIVLYCAGIVWRIIMHKFGLHLKVSQLLGMTERQPLASDSLKNRHIA
jgi:hypothetical protein